LLGQYNKVASYHKEWTKQLKEKYGLITDAKEADRILEKTLGDKFARVLEDTGVFKSHDTLKRFIDTLNMKQD